MKHFAALSFLPFLVVFLTFTALYFPSLSPVFAQTDGCCNDNCACACWGGSTDKDWYCKTCWNGGSVGYFDVTTNSCQFNKSLQYQPAPNYTPICTSQNQTATLAKPCCPGLTQCADNSCKTTCSSTGKNICYDASNFCQAKTASSCTASLGLYRTADTCWANATTNSTPCYSIIPGNICQSAKPQYCYFSRNFASRQECLRFFESNSQASTTKNTNGLPCQTNSDCQSGYCSSETKLCGPKQTTCYDANSTPPCAATAAADCTAAHLFSTDASCQFALSQLVLTTCFSPDNNCDPNGTIQASSCEPANRLYPDQGSCLDSRTNQTTCLDITQGCIAADSYATCDLPHLYPPDQLTQCLQQWNTDFSSIENGLCHKTGTTCLSPTTEAVCAAIGQSPQSQRSCRPLSCEPTTGYCRCWLPLDDGCVYTSGEICSLGYPTRTECDQVLTTSLSAAGELIDTAELTCDDPSLYYCDNSGSARACIDGTWQRSSASDTLCCTNPGDNRCLDVASVSFTQTCTDNHTWQITGKANSCQRGDSIFSRVLTNWVNRKQSAETEEKSGLLHPITKYFRKPAPTSPQEDPDTTPPPQELAETQAVSNFLSGTSTQLDTCYQLSPIYCDAIAEVNLYLLQQQTIYYQQKCFSGEFTNHTCQTVLNQLATSISNLLDQVPAPKPLPWWKHLLLRLAF